MSHIPYGYRIENGLAVIEEEAAKQLRTLFKAYLSGDSLINAATKSGINAPHTAISRMLTNNRYLGDGYYPAIIDPDTLAAAGAERARRAEKLGRIREPKKEKKTVYPTVFRLREGTEHFDDPFEQAAYAYSLIETEVEEDGCQ